MFFIRKILASLMVSIVIFSVSLESLIASEIESIHSLEDLPYMSDEEDIRASLLDTTPVKKEISFSHAIEEMSILALI